MTKLHNTYATGGRVTHQGSVFMFEVVFEEIAWGNSSNRFKSPLSAQSTSDYFDAHLGTSILLASFLRKLQKLSDRDSANTVVSNVSTSGVLF